MLHRSKGELDSDIAALNMCLSKHISDLPANVRNIWDYVFSEMINNVMDHSGSEVASVHVYRNYLRTVVSIADSGIGIFEKIRIFQGRDAGADKANFLQLIPDLQKLLFIFGAVIVIKA